MSSRIDDREYMERLRREQKERDDWRRREEECNGQKRLNYEADFKRWVERGGIKPKKGDYDFYE